METTGNIGKIEERHQLIVVAHAVQAEAFAHVGVHSNCGRCSVRHVHKTMQVSQVRCLTPRNNEETFLNPDPLTLPAHVQYMYQTAYLQLGDWVIA